MNYQLFDNHSIKQYHPKGTYPILIRIMDPIYKQFGVPYELPTLAEYRAVLEVYIDERDEQITGINPPPYFFNKSMAIQLIQFVQTHPADEIVVHGNQGTRRTPAIMMGLALILNKADWYNEILNQPHYHPNQHILNVFEKELNQ